jgi:copper oxidase (laccase) domain-containing protein
MFTNPFAILSPYTDRLAVSWLEKGDRIHGDEDILRCVGGAALASLKQMHGGAAIVVREPTQRVIEADGMMTDARGLLLSIRAADCQTFVVYAPERSIVGMMHVGWRCLKAGMIPSFFRTLKEHFSIDGSDVVVGAGPSLCTRCAEFTDPRRELADTEPLIIDGRCADLQGIADAQLRRAGVRPDRFERMAGCTRCDPHRFWTYRGGDRESVMEGWTNILCAKLL